VFWPDEVWSWTVNAKRPVASAVPWTVAAPPVTVTGTLLSAVPEMTTAAELVGEETGSSTGGAGGAGAV
jgi:hypothetical protein